MRMIRFATVMAVPFLFCCVAQAAGPPEYNGIFSERDPRTGAYTDLERTSPAIHTRIRGLGFGGAKVTEDITGARSPVRFHSGTPLEFVVRDSARENDPNATIQLVALKSDNGGRFLETYSAGGFSGAKNTTAKSAIGFTADKFGDVYFKVTPAQPLPPGEYALMMVASPAMMMNGGPPAYCFGVDP